MDKVKAQAQTVSQTAKDAALKGQSKLDELSQRRASDQLLRELGQYCFRARTGEITNEAAEADIARVVALLKAHIAEHGPLED